MPDLSNLETPVLIEMLAQRTAQYTEKIAQKKNSELQQYEYEIAMIQGELNTRQLAKQSAPVQAAGSGVDPAGN